MYACTSNAGKLRELEAAAGSGLEVRTLPRIQTIAPPEETGSSFEENAVLKALYYSDFTREAVLCDDSGLEVDALDGAPGIYSARFAGEQASHAENNQLLLRRLGKTAARAARFVCVVAVAKAGAVVGTARGTVEGEILFAPRGHQGFGYDPLFLYPPLQRSFAELTGEEKQSISHRGRAMRALLASPGIR